MTEPDRPRVGCKYYIDARLKGFILTAVFSYCFSIGSVYLLMDSKIDKIADQISALSTKFEVAKASGKITIKRTQDQIGKTRAMASDYGYSMLRDTFYMGNGYHM